MWGGPTPHNLVTLSLCCAVWTCSEVPITSSDRDTTEAREGRPHSPSLGHPCPGAGSSFTQREVPYDWVSAPRPTPPDASWDHTGDTTHFGRNENKKKDYGRTAQSGLHTQRWHLVVATKACMVCKQVVCILLECFLVKHVAGEDYTMSVQKRHYIHRVDTRWFTDPHMYLIHPCEKEHSPGVIQWASMRKYFFKIHLSLLIKIGSFSQNFIVHNIKGIQ